VTAPPYFTGWKWPFSSFFAAGRRWRNFGLLVYAFFYLTATFAVAVPGRWEVIRGDSIRVYFSPGRERLARQFLENAETSLKQISALLGLDYHGETYIFLANDESQWKAVLQDRIPDWSEGVTQPELGIVYLKLKGDRRSPLVVLKHELVHVLLGKHFSSGQLPRWFEEGLAMLVSGEELGGYASTLSRANLTGSLLSFDEVEQVLSFRRSKAQLAYAESFVAVKLLVESVGWGGIRDLLAVAAMRGSWDEALKTVLELDEKDLEWYVMRKIERSYRWDFLLQSEFVIWVVIPALAVIAFLAVRFRRIRTYRRWEEEEKQQDEGDESEEAAELS